MSTSPPGRPGSFASAALRTGLHVVGLILLVLIVTRAVTARSERGAAIVAVAAVLATAYLTGLLLDPRHGTRRRRRLWLGVIGTLWLVLLALTPDAIWLAFPLFILELVVIADRLAVPTVAVTTAVAVAGFAAHRDGIAPPALVGPVIGALVAVVGVLGYQAIARESEERRELIEQLRGVQAELAEAGRAAGIAAERERLAREIHDTLAQGLSSIQLLLRAVQRDPAADALPSETADHIEAARRTAQENLEEARRFVRELSPPALERATLVGALRNLCSTTTATSSVVAEFRVIGEPVEADTARDVALYRIAQSALANTVRHAGARRVTVTLTHLDSGVALDVVDDGIGFDPDSADRGRTADEGFGIPTMRQRAAAIGASFAIESEPGEGTAVAVLLTDPAAAGSVDAARGSGESENTAGPAPADAEER